MKKRTPPPILLMAFAILVAAGLAGVALGSGRLALEGRARRPCSCSFQTA